MLALGSHGSWFDLGNWQDAADGLFLGNKIATILQKTRFLTVSKSMHGAITAGGSWMAVNLLRSQAGKAEFSRLQNSRGVWSKKKGRTQRAYLLHLVCKKMLTESDAKIGLSPLKTQKRLS